MGRWILALKQFGAFTGKAKVGTKVAATNSHFELLG